MTEMRPPERLRSAPEPPLHTANELAPLAPSKNQTAPARLQTGPHNVSPIWPSLVASNRSKLGRQPSDEYPPVQGPPSADDKLSCATKAAYSFPRLPFSAIALLIVPATKTVYRDALGMPIQTLAMINAICKSFDFLIGFAVGKLSDNTRSRWGRRKPWLMFCGPAFLISTVLLGSPGLFFKNESTAADAINACAELAGNTANSDTETSCPALQACLNAEIAAGRLRAWNETWEEQAETGSGGGVGLALYYALLYFAFFAFGFTGTMIPYDALGMELTSDYNEKTSLFGIKTAFQFLGYILYVVMSIGLAIMFPTDILYVVMIPAILYAALMAISIAIMCCKIEEKKQFKVQSGRQPAEEPAEVPLIPSVRTMYMTNQPYVKYLVFKIPMSMAALLPPLILVGMPSSDGSNTFRNQQDQRQTSADSLLTLHADRRPILWQTSSSSS